MPKVFDEITKQKLGYYVYFLKDPIEKTPFYFGKGKDNRVFDHINCKIKNTTESDKLEKIREILQRKKNNTVEHIILRHGLTEKEAYIVEASIMDYLEYIKAPGLTMIQGGHHSVEKGLMTTDEILRRYNAKPLIKIGSDCVIININKSYKRGIDHDGIYEATRSCWRMNEKRLLNKDQSKKIKFVLSEYHGLIVEVFEVEKWQRGGCGKCKKDKKRCTKNRMCFEGKTAPDKIRNLYVNRSVQKEHRSRQVIIYKIPVLHPHG